MTQKTHIKTFADVLEGNSYPGRALVVGVSDDKKCAIAAYWIMGRSRGSRNRIFEKFGDTLRTVPFDKSITEGDPSLIIYTAMRELGDTLILTNGDQTDTIFEQMQKGKTFEEALATRTFEHDAPNYTPRISSLTKVAEVEGEKVITQKLSIIKTFEGDSSITERFTYSYEGLDAGVGRLITTYEHDGEVLPSFKGEPIPVRLMGNIDDVSSSIWNALDEDNKVALYVRFLNIDTMQCRETIINKITDAEDFDTLAKVDKPSF